MLFLDFLCQKAYAGEFSRPEVILSKGYFKYKLLKCWGGTPNASLPFFKNAIKSEPHRVRG